MSQLPREYLQHIIDEIDFIQNRLQNVDFDSFSKDPILKRAIVRSLEIIGEATKNIPMDFRERHSHIEWSKMAGIGQID